jgi:hypothetical protein
MKEATKNLREQINMGKVDSSRFNGEQLKAIQKGDAQIPDLTWHHHQDTGRMQLIPFDIHGLVCGWGQELGFVFRFAHF